MLDYSTKWKNLDSYKESEEPNWEDLFDLFYVKVCLIWFLHTKRMKNLTFYQTINNNINNIKKQNKTKRRLGSSLNE